MAEPSAAAAPSSQAPAAVVEIPNGQRAARVQDKDAAAGGAAKAVEPARSLLESIRVMKEQQSAMRLERKNLTRVLKNAVKRRNRLKKRARQLTDEDLLEVIQMRRYTAAEDAAEAIAAEPTAGSSPCDPVASAQPKDGVDTEEE